MIRRNCKLKKKNLIIFLLVINLLPITYRVAYGAEKKIDVRILLKKDCNSIEFDHKTGINLQTKCNSFFKIDKSIFTTFIKSSSIPVYYFIPFQQSSSLDKAVLFAKQMLDTTFKNSELNIFLKENLNDFSILLGPFTKKTDADFVKNNLTSYFACKDLELLPINQSFACFQVAKRILYMSQIVPTNQDALVFILSNPDQTITFNTRQYPDNILIYLCKNNTLSVVNQTDMETYLLGVVPSEMPDSWNSEALKAQSIVSRTFSYTRQIQARKSGFYFDVTDDTNSQVYQGRRSSVNALRAIQCTQNMILTFNNQPIESVFHSTSGGYTENNDTIWFGSPSPYLRAVPSPGEEISPHFAWCNRFSMDDFLAKLNQYLVKEKKKSISSIQSIQILEKGESPRVKKVEIKSNLGSIFLSGQNIQQIYSLKSTWFDILITDFQEHQNLPPLLNYFCNSYSDKPNVTIKPTVYIYGRGWGHGVGMSQYGALAQAKKGALYPEILHSFFCQTVISSLENFIISQPKSVTLATCNLSFSPEESKIKINDSKDLILQINTSQNVFGISFDLTYPKKIISLPIEEIRIGTFLHSDGKNIIFEKKETETEIKIVLSREGKSSGGVSGRGDLLMFRLKALQAGAGKIEITNLKVFDAQLNSVYSESTPYRIEIFEPDVSPPKTQIISFPDQFTNKKLVFFEWNGIDDQTISKNLLFAYRLNDEPWSIFSKETSHYFSIQTDGNYVFFVKSRDETGNEDPFPPSYSFSIDLTAPSIKIFDYPEITNLKQITLTGTSEPGVTFLINGKPVFIDKKGQFSHTVSLDIGKNIFRLIAIDQASNTTTKDVVIERIFKRNVIIFMTIGSTKAQVNDQIVTMDIAPLIKDNRTLIPLRFIAEAFGATVLWNDALQQIDITLQTSTMNHKIILWIGKKISIVDSVQYNLETAPTTLPPGRTVVPIRFIAEAFESSVDWQPLTRSIKITFPKIKSEE
jgi:stage II sporulation protein D